MAASGKAYIVKFPFVVMSSGDYSHYGLVFGLQPALKHVENVPPFVLLTVDVDGLPLGKSSKTQLWPAQWLIHDCGNNRPFVVGAYAGPSKPTSAIEFLKSFVVEFASALSNGVVVSGQSIQIKPKWIVCDAPAWTFIIMANGHGVYSGCPYCAVESTCMGNNDVFFGATSRCVRISASELKNMKSTTEEYVILRSYVSTL